MSAAPATKATPTKQSPLAAARAAAATHASRASSHLAFARTKLDAAAAHPHAQKALAFADEQVRSVRSALGRSESVMAAEAATGVDRVRLVAGALAAFILLVPLNLFNLAATTTSALTLALPAYKALIALERGGPTDNLLAYFVVLGYFQVLESFILPFLVSQFPRYYTIKLVFMFYLVHPRLNGATKLYNLLFSHKLKTPPMSPTSSNGPDFRGPLSSVSPTTRGAAVPLPMSPSPAGDRVEDMIGGFTRIPRAVKE